MGRWPIFDLLGQRLFCTGEWFVGEVIDLFDFQPVFVWFPGDCGFLNNKCS